MNRNLANQRKGSFSRLKRMWWIAGGVLLLASAGLAVAWPQPTGGSPSGSEAIATVGGQPISLDEFRLYMDKAKGEVTNYFSVTYGAEDRKDYWTSAFGGERPIDRLKKQAMKDAVEGKTLQLLAVENGLAESSSFADFTRNWNDNNQSRAKDLKQGKAIYGLGEYDLSQFYFYSISNLKLDLAEKLGERELKVTDQELLDRYQSHAEFAGQTQLTYKELSIPFGDGEREQAYKQITEAQQELKAGLSFEEAAKKYTENGLRDNTVIIGGQDSPLQADAVLKQAAARLEIGEYSPVLDCGSGFSIIRLVNRTDNFSVPLDSVKAQLQEEVLQLKFQAYLADQVKKRNVQIKQDVYDQLKKDQ
ncbi:peptidylprolyl isomerase [Paenibacillus sp. JDR-2]|uniref:peptidylprolyl isomerase n=1 Tax=Paenibacillus sp. (strain JDR-2) TaxID=324057 RepID=UPI000166A585|nr:peptidylprolyl isomerase [Paenibacillus sp. JDR-2]